MTATAVVGLPGRHRHLVGGTRHAALARARDRLGAPRQIGHSCAQVAARACRQHLTHPLTEVVEVQDVIGDSLTQLCVCGSATSRWLISGCRV
jgi:hypothetical protein